VGKVARDRTKQGEEISGSHACSRRQAHEPARRGVASLDYILVLGVLLPLAVFVLWAGPRLMRLAYEMLAVLVSWPFV
jgi:hypothetical protein